MQNVQLSVLPRSSLGRWSVGLAVTSILFFVLSEVLTGFQVLGPGNNRALALALTGVLAGIEGAVFVTGLMSLMKSRERSVLVFLATAISLYSLVGATVSMLGLPK